MRIPVILGLLLLAPNAVVAAPGSPYRLHLSVDLPLLGLGVAGTAIAFVELPPATCLPSCSPPAGLNGLDRSVLGNYSPTSHTIADVTVLTLAFAPLALDLLDSGGDGWVEDATVHLETLLLAQAITQLTKVAVRRTAPFVYDATVPLAERMNADSTRSFPSGHTAMAFAAATSYAVTYWLRHPDDPWRWAVLVVAEGLALGVGLLKINAGYHYWTDVGAAAVVGGSIGALVPLLHAG